MIPADLPRRRRTPRAPGDGPQAPRPRCIGIAGAVGASAASSSRAAFAPGQTSGSGTARRRPSWVLRRASTLAAWPPSRGRVYQRRRRRAWPRTTHLSRHDASRPRTHCPYCALQCGMTPARAAGRRHGTAAARSRGRDFPTNRGGLCQKGWTARRAARTTRTGSPPRCCAGARRRRCAPASAGTRPSTVVAAAAAGVRGRARAGRRRASSAAAGSPTRRPTARQVRPGRAAAPRSIDYNGRFCMSSAAAAGQPRLRPRPRAAVPAGRPRRRRAPSCCSAPTSPRPCRRSCSTCRAARRAAALIVVDPRRTATAAYRRRRRPAPAAGARHRPRPASGCCTS